MDIQSPGNRTIQGHSSTLTFILLSLNRNTQQVIEIPSNNHLIAKQLPINSYFHNPLLYLSPTIIGHMSHHHHQMQ